MLGRISGHYSGTTHDQQPAPTPPLYYNNDPASLLLPRLAWPARGDLILDTLLEAFLEFWVSFDICTRHTKEGFGINSARFYPAFSRDLLTASMSTAATHAFWHVLQSEKVSTSEVISHAISLPTKRDEFLFHMEQ